MILFEMTRFVPCIFSILSLISFHNFKTYSWFREVNYIYNAMNLLLFFLWDMRYANVFDLEIVFFRV